MEYDFSGYATRANVLCTDGRIIRPNAFKDNHTEVVPLVWQHRHNEPQNVLGHAVLENREDGMYAYGKFNNTTAGQNAKELVKHGDIKSLSIYANKLVQKGSEVIHGMIREVSLVVSGANSGAFIDNIAIAHSDGSYTYSDTEAIIYNDDELVIDEIKHEEVPMENTERTPEEIYESMNDEQREMLHSMLDFATSEQEEYDYDNDFIMHDDATLKDIFETLNTDQKNMVYAMIGQVLESVKTEKPIKHEEDDSMKVNVFDNTDEGNTNVLSHSEIQTIFADAAKFGSLRESVLAHAEEYGVKNIDKLFPEVSNVTPTPEMISRDMKWVGDVLKGTRKTPFSRIKSTAIDITAEEARARGYVKGTMKKDEIVSTLRRTTGPTTIYKKQKLDRDDILDITDFDIVLWLKAEMRLMLDEEIARAVLIGDGRDIESEDKINETSIRPIAYDNNLYAHQVTIPAGVTGNNLIEAILRARKHYKGKGSPAFYTTESILVDLLLLKDKIGRRLYNTEAELSQALRVREIIPVEPMEEVPNILGIMVNMNDYTIGTNKGGDVSMFDDFDIDFNQHKYLIETRMSGALTAPKTALVFKRDQGVEVSPFSPSFDTTTGVLTVPSKTGVIYKLAGVLEDEVLEAGEQEAIDRGETIEVIAVPDVGYHFPHNTIATWEYTREL